jgi:RNA polymerase sigma factor (sigma-70 family)
VSNQPTVDVSHSPKDRAIDPAEILGMHLSWLRTVVRARLMEPEDVEDVLQNMAIALSTAAQLPSQQGMAPWLYRVAVREVLQLRRRKGRQRRLVAKWAAERPAPEPVGPVEQLMAFESRIAVREALDRLGDVDRQVLLLKYTENWNYLDLSRHLGVSRGAIEHRLNKARARLREELRGTHSPDRNDGHE